MHPSVGRMGMISAVICAQSAGAERERRQQAPRRRTVTVYVGRVMVPGCVVIDSSSPKSYA